MADKHNDNIPAVGNEIAADIPDIKENLEFHKDAFQNFCKGWSNSSAANLFPHIIKDDDEDTMIQLEESSDEDIIRFDTEGTERATLDENGLKLTMTASSTPQANTLLKDNIIKGWIHFTGSGTISIEDSFNVTSITDNGAGDFSQ